MSVTVELCEVPPRDDEYLEAAWDLKERIRHEEDVLKQRRSFFARAYRRGRNYLLVTDRDEVIGFATTRSDGYILFLAVDPTHQGEGFGRRLVGAVAGDHEVVTCHARTTNERAVAFYRSLGFEVVRHIASYYEDGGDAYYLRLGEPRSLTAKLKEYVGTS